MRFCLALSSSLLLISSLAFGQVNPTSDTVKWTSGSFVDVNSNQTVPLASEFITYGPSSVEWLQQQGELQSKRVYDVVTVTGDWNSTGYVQYTLTANGKETILRFEHVNNTNTITMKVMLNQQVYDEYRFTVNEVIKISGQQ